MEKIPIIFLASVIYRDKQANQCIILWDHKTREDAVRPSWQSI
jgi:hypothetical protein